MAKVTNAFDTYSAQADREALSNVIYNISPQQTPFMSSIGKNNVKNVVFDWQTESLPTASGAGQLEGFELSRSAATATVRDYQTYVKSLQEMQQYQVHKNLQIQQVKNLKWLTNFL